jgi:transglutaminase superfamily protein
MFFRVVVLLPAISLSLKMRGFRATQQALQNFSFSRGKEKGSGQRVTDGERVKLAVQMVNAAARHGLGRSSCLERSLALWWLLHQEGIASSVRIGARKTDGKFEAHAWVELEGVALNEPQQEHRHYATFDAAFPLQSSEIS